MGFSKDLVKLFYKFLFVFVFTLLFLFICMIFVPIYCNDDKKAGKGTKSHEGLIFVICTVNIKERVFLLVGM